ncbi:MAG: DnaJ domain-containing protein, partial [Gloeobacterales cyanobacterium]
TPPFLLVLTCIVQTVEPNFMGKDFYNILNVDPQTDKEEIRKSYIKLASLYHPDVSKDPGARERFEEINLAYTILSNDETRIIYNLYYKEAQEDSSYPALLPWWKRYALGVSVCILAFGIFMWMSLLVWLVAGRSM